MSRSVGLAYALTGAAIASAVIAITASTAGLLDGGQAASAAAAVESAPLPASVGLAAGEAAAAAAGMEAQGVGVRDVSGPADGRRSHGERERFEHSEREDDDD